MRGPGLAGLRRGEATRPVRELVAGPRAEDGEMVPKVATGEDAGGRPEAGRRGVPGLLRANAVEAGAGLRTAQGTAQDLFYGGWRGWRQSAWPSGPRGRTAGGAVVCAQGGGLSLRPCSWLCGHREPLRLPETLSLISCHTSPPRRLATWALLVPSGCGVRRSHWGIALSSVRGVGSSRPIEKLLEALLLIPAQQ